jgi:putative ABC transport system permease protein
MQTIYRGIKNAFRNYTRLIAIIVIIGLAIGLSLSMVVARQAVSSKINTINSKVGTTITITPAGIVGFSGGGNPLTTQQINPISKDNNVINVQENLNDRLKSNETNLTSGLKLGALGRRFAAISNSVGGFGSSQLNFSPPITVQGTTNPTNLNGSVGGGNFQLISGSVFSSNSNANVALVGQAIANQNNLKVGSTFKAYNTTITVIGIFKSGNSFSDNQIIMPLETVQTLSSEPNDLSKVILTIDNINNLTAVTNQIQKQLGSSATITNSIQTAQNTIAPLRNIQDITLYTVIGTVVAGAVIIFMIMVMIVRERRKEIGILKAIGATNLKIIFQFMVESLTLTLIGALIGIIIGAIAATPITNLLVSNSKSSSNSNISFNRGGGFGGIGGGNANFRFTRPAHSGIIGGVKNSYRDIHAIVGWSIIIDGVGAALVIALAGSILASYSISRISPSEVIRNE